MEPMYEACEREINELHEFFEDWFNAARPDTDEEFSRLSDVLSRDFVMIIPEGQKLRRSELLQSVRNSHGIRRGTDISFDIWVEDVVVEVDDDSTVVATYQEWQRLDGDVTARLSSVVFRRDPEAPNGLSWRHLHEVWMQEPEDVPDDADNTVE